MSSLPLATARSKIRGSLLAGAVGDALGAPVEFMSLEEIRHQHGPAGVTGYLPAYGRPGGAITDVLILRTSRAFDPFAAQPRQQQSVEDPHCPPGAERHANGLTRQSRSRNADAPVEHVREALGRFHDRSGIALYTKRRVACKSKQPASTRRRRPHERPGTARTAR